MHLSGTLAQETTDMSSGGVGFVVLFSLLWLVLLAAYLIGCWKVYEKIGLPGWMGIVPFVNVYMLFKARGQRDPVLWLVLSLIPCINFVAYWFLANDTAEIFDEELGWKLFLFFIPGISHMVLGFGSMQANPARIAPGVGLNELAPPPPPPPAPTF
jgi:Family of unknown function (DUF5684)